MNSKELYDKCMEKITDKERFGNAEIQTPPCLKEKMVDLIPEEFWKTPKRVFEPCCGKIGFIPEIVNKFYSNNIEMETIVKDCLFMNDINPTNISIVKEILGRDDINITCEDVLKSPLKECFDAVIMNPPYNTPKTSSRGQGSNLYLKFLKSSLDWVKEGGYVCMIIPAGWRRPYTKRSINKGIFQLVCNENQLVYCSMYGRNRLKKTWKADLSVDILLIKKEKPTLPTTIVDIDGVEHQLRLDNVKWLPNGSFTKVFEYFSQEEDEEARVAETKYGKENSRKEQTEEFKYPVINSGGNDILYMNRPPIYNDGIILYIDRSAGRTNMRVEIKNGGSITTNCVGRKCKTMEEAERIRDFLMSPTYSSIRRFLLFSIWTYDNSLLRFIKLKEM